MNMLVYFYFSLIPRFPNLFQRLHSFLVYVEKIREHGDEATFTQQSNYMYS